MVYGSQWMSMAIITQVLWEMAKHAPEIQAVARGGEKMMAYCREADLEWVMIDSTIVRAHACSMGYGKNSQDRETLGRSKVED